MTNKINGRTPEEIKRGLECCNADVCYKVQGECPYDRISTCVRLMCADTLAFIRQLERERDAAVNDLETMGEDRAYCDTCLHNNTDHKAEPCSSCMSGYLINNWQWRGVQEVKK